MENKEDLHSTGLIFLAIHAFELEKQARYIISEKRKGMKMTDFAVFKIKEVLKAVSNLNIFFSYLVDKKEHEEITLIIDDLIRLLVKNPTKGELIMNELREFVEKHEINIDN